MNKKKTILPLLMASVLATAGCAGAKNPNTNSSTVNQSNHTNSTEKAEASSSQGKPTANAGSRVSASELFSDRDLRSGYEKAGSVSISLNGSSASCSSNAVTILGSRITITDEGTYILSGTLKDGMVIVDAGSSDKVQLVLNGATITSSASAAIYVRQADKVFLTTAANTKNTLSNGGAYEAVDETNIDAVIFSKEDLTLNGKGSLKILARAGHGVVSKDSLVLTGGSYDITAENHGLSGKDCVCIADGTYQITAGKDGIHAENADDAALGFFYIADGDFTITAEGDGISSAFFGQIEDGRFQIQAGGGAPSKSPEPSQSGPVDERIPALPEAQNSKDDETASTKGIKAGGNLWLDNGTFDIDAADDGLHTNSNIDISGGSYQIASGDDGIHADDNASVSDGTIHVSQSYEGLEGKSIDISGGELSLTADDDGINAAGGADSSGFGARGDSFAASDDVCITISGGILHVKASGDGIDSNGNLTVTGGQTYVSGPSGSGNGSLDYNGEASITGGIFAAAGAMGMAQNFGSSSTQGAMLVQTNAGSEGDEISLTDADGNVLVSWQTETAYSCVLISSPKLTQGNTYTLTAAGSSSQIEMTSLIYGQGNGPGHGGMGGKDGMGGRHGMGGKDGMDVGKDGMDGSRDGMDNNNGSTGDIDTPNENHGTAPTPPDTFDTKDTPNTL